MNEGFTQQNMLELGKKMKETHKDETPFPVNDDKTKITVVGNANLTQVKKNNYVIKYRMDKSIFDETGEQPPENAKLIGQWYIFSITYNNISITPRQDTKIMAALFDIIPFYNNLKEDGGIESKTENEIIELYLKAGDVFHLALYNFVAAFLGIDDFSGQYMLPGSVLRATHQILDNHPELFNEADIFFG